MKTFLCVMATALICLAGAAKADLIVNGNFDTDLSGWSYVPTTGTTAGTMWDYNSDGSNPAFADLHLVTYLYQGNTTHPFAEGETYTISFTASGEGATGKLLARFYDAATNTPVASLTLTRDDLGTGDPVNFKPYSFQYVVDPSRIGHAWELDFDSADDGANPAVWTGVDSVHVTVSSIPEPTALILLATGLIGLVAYAWRKRR
jgi:hypothetical protein